MGSMAGVKVSVSLPDADVAYLDEYVENNRVATRSAALHEAIKLLRMSELESAYAEAFEDWEQDEDTALWDATVSDGLADATR